MNKEAIIEYYRMLDTLELFDTGLKSLYSSERSYKYDSISNVTSHLLNDMRRFGINQIGCLDEQFT